MSNELTTTKQNSVSIFGQFESMESAWAAAKSIANSQLVPESFKNKPEDVLIVLDQAQRLNMSPIMILQNTHIIHGRPSFSSSFLIACLNSSGRFSPIDFEMGVDGECSIGTKKIKNTTCKVVTTSKNGHAIEGPEVSIQMSIAEGWYGKKMSKWQTMPELMLRYRAAAFFARLYAPDIMMGMNTKDEAYEMEQIPEANAKEFEAHAPELEVIKDIPKVEKPKRGNKPTDKTPIDPVTNVSVETVAEPETEEIPQADDALWED